MMQKDNYNFSGHRVHLVSLGCARNRVDSEVMLGTLGLHGASVASEPADADTIIVNTCGFIDAAKEESINTILEMAHFRNTNPELNLVVTGCLTQRYKTQLAKGLPEVDLFIGTDEFPRIAELLTKKIGGDSEKIYTKRSHYIYSAEMPRINTLNKFSAYVKVAEGCQHNCSFCIIPAIRGRLRSRPLVNVLEEVKQLVTSGVIEINLIAQDLAAYGRDLEGHDLVALLRALVKIEGLKWIRLLYVYPENINDEFLDFIASEEKIVKYLDIPVQHASDKILSAMKRDINRQGLAEIFARLREKVPNLTLRTSVMVGFPGESDEDFAQLLTFVEEQKFSHLGCFKYSKEEGTVAGRMSEQIDEDIKTQRQALVMQKQQAISRNYLQKYIGQTVPVLIEGPSAETELLWQGRIASQAPEIDGLVYINEGEPQIGKIQNVKITEAHEYDLIGTALPSNSFLN